MRLISILALAVLIAPLAARGQSSKPAQKSKREIREIKATGCVFQGTPPDCLLMKTFDGKTTYSLFADPTPVVGTVIIIEAKPRLGPNACKQSMAVDVVKWEYTGEQCVP